MDAVSLCGYRQQEAGRRSVSRSDFALPIPDLLHS